MAVTEQPKTFSDLFTDLQNRVRVATGITATENQAKRYINIALHDMHLGTKEKFPWAEREAVLTTQAPYNTGTVTISKGSASLTGSSTLWNTNNDFSVANVRVGGKLVINGTIDVYEVSAVASDTAITLTEKYVGDDVSAGTYSYFEDEYALHDDFLRPLDLNYFDNNQQVPLLDRRTFRERYVRNKTTGKVIAATIVDKAFSGNTSPVRKLLLHKPPDKAYLLPYAFITDKLAVSSSGAAQVQLVEDTDEPIIPLYSRHILVFHALYHWYRDKKNDTRSQEAKAEYTEGMFRLTSDIEVGGPRRPQMRPRSYLSSSQHGWRRSNRHTTGSRFDEIR